MKKMPCIYAHRPILWRQFLNCSFLFLPDSSLCHVDKNLTRLSIHLWINRYSESYKKLHMDGDKIIESMWSINSEKRWRNSLSYGIKKKFTQDLINLGGSETFIYLFHFNSDAEAHVCQVDPELTEQPRLTLILLPVLPKSWNCRSA